VCAPFELVALLEVGGEDACGGQGDMSTTRPDASRVRMPGGAWVGRAAIAVPRVDALA